MNQPIYQDASILLARENFGCGSSREHAVWALADAGFRVVIAPSFADIFYNNCSKNGVLAIVLKENEMDALFALATRHAPAQARVDLPSQQVQAGAGSAYHFSIDDYRKENLLSGLDDIGLTLKHADTIRAFENQRRQNKPWLFRDL